MLIMAFWLLPVIAAFIALCVLPANSHKWEKYAVFFLVPTSALGIFLSWSLVPSNVAGRTKKSIVNTLMFIAYSAGNIVGPQLFKTVRLIILLALDF